MINNPIIFNFFKNFTNQRKKINREEVLKVHSQSEKIFDNWKPFENDEKCFFFTWKTLLVLLSFSLDFLVL